MTNYTAGLRRVLAALFVMTAFYVLILTDFFMDIGHGGVRSFGFKPPQFRNVTRTNLTPTRDVASYIVARTNTSTSNVYTTATIVHPKPTYAVNDTVWIRITARDTNNTAKTVGGDYFRVKFYSKLSKSSSAADVTNDLGNGTYLACFRLRWPGEMKVLVTLVHPREAVKVLERIWDFDPGRMSYIGRYFLRVGKNDVVEDVKCLPKVMPNVSICNFTDVHAGYPLTCEHPKNKSLSCAHWRYSKVNVKLSTNHTMAAITKEEKEIFKIHKLPIKATNDLALNVTGDIDSWFRDLQRQQKSLPPCQPGQHIHDKAPSGFFYQNTWYSDQCNIRRFNRAATLSCLQNKSIHIFGDSTSRQIYSYLAEKFRPDIVGGKPKDRSQDKAGPLRAKGAKRNTFIEYKFHGFPYRSEWFIRRETMNYIENELDQLDVNAQSVVLICIGTHFTTHPLEMYEERIRGIRAALERLQARSPHTLVILKSANTREHRTILHQLHNSEWYIRTLDLRLRALFKDFQNIAFIDAWDLTIAQNFPHSVHPNIVVVGNIVNYVLSFICPGK